MLKIFFFKFYLLQRRVERAAPFWRKKNALSSFSFDSIFFQMEFVSVESKKKKKKQTKKKWPTALEASRRRSMASEDTKEEAVAFARRIDSTEKLGNHNQI